MKLNLKNIKVLKEYTFDDLKIELEEFVTYYIHYQQKFKFSNLKILCIMGKYFLFSKL